MIDNNKFLGENHYGSINLAGSTNGYNYTQVKQNVHQDSMAPAMQISLFIVAGLCLSCCLVVCIGMLITQTESVGDLFKSDGAQVHTAQVGGNSYSNQ